MPKGELRYFAHQLSSSFKELILVNLADVHYGNPLCSIEHYDKDIKFVKETRNAFATLNGDLCESSLRTSKGDIFEQVGSPQKQRDWQIARLKPIKHKILGMTTGNHEIRLAHEGLDISEDIAKALNIPYRPEGILLKISFGDHNNWTKGKPYSYFVYLTHGYGGARTKAAKAVKVERLATWIHADLYIMSHDHVVNVAPDVYLMPDARTTEDPATGWLTGKVRAHRKILVKSNAYLKWGGYAEQGGFPPVDLESPRIILKGTGEPRIKVEV